jgi:hypothetical protein
VSGPGRGGRSSPPVAGLPADRRRGKRARGSARGDRSASPEPAAHTAGAQGRPLRGPACDRPSCCRAGRFLVGVR